MGRTPDGTPPCTGADVLEIVDLLVSAGVDLWVDGGWGIDALLGEQTRPHADLHDRFGLPIPAVYARWSR